MNLTLPKMDGHEVAPGIFVIGEPTPIPGTCKLRALVNVHGALATAELKFRFSAVDVIELGADGGAQGKEER